jgi:hypothetical protein
MKKCLISVDLVCQNMRRVLNLKLYESISIKALIYLHVRDFRKLRSLILYKSKASHRSGCGDGSKVNARP